MSEQELEFDSYNTMDYAMHRHDIKRLEELTNLQEVNNKLALGWVLLAIIQVGDQIQEGEPMCYSHPIYIMGVPRPRMCLGNFKIKHDPMAMIWHHSEKEWHCPTCE